VFSPQIPKQEGKSQVRTNSVLKEEQENSVSLKWNDARPELSGMAEKSTRVGSSNRVTQLVALQQTANQSSYHQKFEEQVQPDAPSTAIQGSGEVIQGMFARGARTGGRVLRQLEPQVRGTFTAAGQGGARMATKMPPIAGPLVPTAVAPGASAAGSSSGGLLGKLLTGVGIANAGVETYKAYNDESTNGNLAKKGGKMAMAAAGGAFGRFGMVGNAVSAYGASGKADFSSIPGFLGFPQTAQDTANGAAAPTATPTEAAGSGMLDSVKAVTSHATDGPEAVLHGMEGTRAAFEKFLPQVGQAAEKSKTLKLLKHLPAAGIALADVKTFAGNLIDNRGSMQEFFEKHNKNTEGVDHEEMLRQFGSSA
jgi:hypothetical protein